MLPSIGPALALLYHRYPGCPMIDTASQLAVDQTRWNAHFIKPLYDSYCFAQIPRLVDSLVGSGDGAALQDMLLGPLSGRYDRVILFFIDAFGWRFLTHYEDRYPFLRRIVAEGMVTKLTSQFPSTTAAHVTAVHTGLPVGQSGVYEWFYYEPLVDAIISPLLFSFAGDQARGTLERTGVTPRQLFPQTTLYHTLRRHGVTSYVFQSRDHAFSPFSTVVCDGAHPRPFATFHDALTDLVDLVVTGRGPSYYFVYLGSIDAAGHRYGVHSPQFEAEVDACFTMLEAVLHQGLAGKARNSLVLLTADHGQVAIQPETTVYLNRDLPALTPWIETNHHGQPLAPAGSARDMFLHIREERLDETRSLLQEHLAGRAEVHRVRDLIDRGFFGAEVSPALLDRVGNLVVLPYQHESVWWYDKGRFSQDFYGHHGGLTPPEMETVLLALPYG